MKFDATLCAPSARSASAAVYLPRLHSSESAINVNPLADARDPVSMSQVVCVTTGSIWKELPSEVTALIVTV